MPKYSAHYSSSSSSSKLSKGSQASGMSSSHPYLSKRFHDSITHLNTAADHAKWEAVILSPQFANSLDHFFAEWNDFQSTVLIDQVCTSDLIPIDIALIMQTAPTAALNLMHIHQRLKTLTFSLMNWEKMNEACNFAVSHFDDMPELVIESPQWNSYTRTTVLDKHPVLHTSPPLPPLHHHVPLHLTMSMKE